MVDTILLAIAGGIGGAGATGAAFTLLINSQNKKITQQAQSLSLKVDVPLCDLKHDQIEKSLKIGDRQFNTMVEKIEILMAELAETNKQLALVAQQISVHRENRA